jgi:hypothetical protein
MERGFVTVVGNKEMGFRIAVDHEGGILYVTDLSAFCLRRDLGNVDRRSSARG